MTLPRPYRPGIVNLITIVSFVLSGLNVLWLITVTLLLVFAGALSWLGGPVIGAIGTLAVGVVVVVLLAQFCLSVLLFMAALGTMGGRPEGRTRHKRWAWIIVILDLITLVFTAGLDFAAWFRLGYAIFLIYVLDKPEVRSYFGATA